MGDVKILQVRKLVYNNTAYEEPASIAELFCRYFSTAGSFCSHIEPNLLHPVLSVERNPHSFYFEPVTPAECSEYVKNLKLTKQDINCIPVHLLKYFCNTFSFVLADLVNKSFDEGVFPKCLKRAIVLPIYKGGIHSDIGNYRPISIP